MVSGQLLKFVTLQLWKFTITTKNLKVNKKDPHFGLFTPWSNLVPFGQVNFNIVFLTCVFLTRGSMDILTSQNDQLSIWILVNWIINFYNLIYVMCHHYVTSLKVTRHHMLQMVGRKTPNLNPIYNHTCTLYKWPHTNFIHMPMPLPSSYTTFCW